MSGHTYTCGPMAPCRPRPANWKFLAQDPTTAHCWHETTARRMAWIYGDDAQALDAAMARMNDDARRWNAGRPDRSGA